MTETDIQWADDTANPTMGCDGCELSNATQQTCYAEQLTNRYAGRTGWPTSFRNVRYFPDRTAKGAAKADLRGLCRLSKPWLDGLPRLIFLSDMGDCLSRSVTFDYLEQQIVNVAVGSAGRRHCWLWLTKRPPRMAEFSAWLEEHGRAWPANVWAGTSITTQGTTGRVDDLLKVGDHQTLRFLSVEPQIEQIDLRKWLPRMNWIIQGGESGDVPSEKRIALPVAGERSRRAREFQLEWAYDLRDQCRKARVPYFLKQLGSLVTLEGERLRLADRHGDDWSEWPADLRVRQMPRVSRVGGAVPKRQLIRK